MNFEIWIQNLGEVVCISLGANVFVNGRNLLPSSYRKIVGLPGLFSLSKTTDEGCILPFYKKGDLGITKNYRGRCFTTIATEVYDSLLLNSIWRWENFKKKSKRLLEKSIHCFSDYSSNHRKTTWCHTFICRFLLGMWFHTLKKYEANTKSIWSS